MFLYKTTISFLVRNILSLIQTKLKHHITYV